MSEQKKQGTAFIALLLGVVGGIAPFTYFLMALGFLSVPGFLLALTSYRRTRTTFSKVSLAINIVSLLLLLCFIIERNYSDYKSSKTVYEYYLPKAYTGWVIIKTNDHATKPLPVQSNFPGGIYKILIPPSGTLETCDKLEGWHKTCYFWYDEKDTLAFTPESGSWGDANYKTLIHCEGGSNRYYYHFYVSDQPRNPQDTVILNACETLFRELEKK